MKQPKPNIAKRLKKGAKAKHGQKVLVTASDGTQYVGEIIEFHGRIKNWITKVKKVNDDGKVEVKEVADLVVEAVIVVKDIVLSDVFKAIGEWFKNIFKKK